MARQLVKSRINKVFYKKNCSTKMYIGFNQMIADFITYVDSRHFYVKRCCREILSFGVHLNAIIDLQIYLTTLYIKTLRCAYGAMTLYGLTRFEATNLFKVLTADLTFLIGYVPINTANADVYIGMIPKKYTDRIGKKNVKTTISS